MLRSTGEKIDALSVFGRQIRFDLAEGFPLVTTKKVPFGAIVHELIWFLRGSTNIAYLKEHGVTHLGRVGRRERRARPGLRQAMAIVGRTRRPDDRPDRGRGSRGSRRSTPIPPRRSAGG